MDQPWYRKLFQRPQTQQPKASEVRADHGEAETPDGPGHPVDPVQGPGGDEGEAVARYRQGANRNQASAQFSLGMMLAEGRGVTRNDTEARQWILLAAEQGHPGAQHDLGARCRRACTGGSPEHTSELNIEAYKWFRLAADQGHGGSEGEVENLAVRMTRAQVVEGDERVARFVARPSRLSRQEEPHGPGSAG